jgi:hypothetical protein
MRCGNHNLPPTTVLRRRRAEITSLTEGIGPCWSAWRRSTPRHVRRAWSVSSVGCGMTDAIEQSNSGTWRFDAGAGNHGQSDRS